MFVRCRVQGIVDRIGRLQPARGTLAYAAPEVVSSHVEGRDMVVEPAQDMWAIGVIIYEATVQVRHTLVVPFRYLLGVLAFMTTCHPRSDSTCVRLA